MRNGYEIRGDMAVIFLRHKGELIETVIDAEDLDKVMIDHKTSWCVLKDNKNGSMYAFCRKQTNLKATKIMIHRLVMSCPEGYVVDHINRNSLDNRKINLRVCTTQENQQNRAAYRGGKARGIHYNKKDKKWYARVGVNNDRITIGTYDTKEEAERAVKIARSKLHPLSEEASENEFKGVELKFNKRKQHIEKQSGVRGISWISSEEAWVARRAIDGKRRVIAWSRDLETVKEKLLLWEKTHNKTHR